MYIEIEAGQRFNKQFYTTTMIVYIVARVEHLAAEFLKSVFCSKSSWSFHLQAEEGTILCIKSCTIE